MTPLTALRTGAQTLRRKAATARRMPGLLEARISDPWLGYAAGHGQSGIAAKLLRQQVKTVKEAEVADDQRLTALMLPKPGLVEDVMASFGADPRFRLMVLRREAVKAMARSFFPATVDDNTYGIGDSAIDAGKAPYRTLWTQVWRRLNADLGVDVILTGNFSYFAEQELAAAAEACGTAFVALHKENLKTPGLEPLYEDIYRTRKGPFQGSLIATYNEIERGIQHRAGTFPADRIVVTGMPRLDHIHHWRERHAGQDVSKSERPTVLFMSYNEKTGCPYIGRKTDDGQERLAPELEAVRWNELVVAGHSAVAELARRHPDIDVVIKTKDHDWAFGALRRGLGENFTAPPNLRIVSGGDPFELIVSADVLSGFNSTSLFEALAANVPIVVPRFAEAGQERFSPYVVDLGDAAVQPRQPEEFIDALAAKARERGSRNRTGSLGRAQQDMLQHWIGNPDGRAGERTVALVAGHLEKRRGTVPA